MNCHDAREWFSDLLGGRIALTEWALIEAAAALSSPRGPALEAAREAPGPMALATHVVGRLSARDPRVAERDFTALVAGVGGTELGRHHRVTFTSVEVVVPQSRYEEFARGLARIGSWRLEALRFPLPEAVHMTIRVGE